MEKVIITGATGVFGTALVRRLVENKIYTVMIGHKNSRCNHLICQNQYVTLIYRFIVFRVLKNCRIV